MRSAQALDAWCAWSITSAKLLPTRFRRQSRSPTWFAEKHADDAGRTCVTYASYRSRRGSIGGEPATIQQ